MEIKKLKSILEAVLLAADRVLTVIQLEGLFELDEERPTRDEIRKALHEMADDYEGRGYELKQVASGFRLQVRQEYATWIGRLWEEKPARYTRALLETMALIAYRQPITRGEIEEVRGVSVSSNIIKTLLERDWIKVLGHKDVPGKPTLYGTTKEFLDYFNLKTLDQLPTLAEIKDLDSIHPELELDDDAEKTPEGNDGESGADSVDTENGPSEPEILAEESAESVSDEDELASEEHLIEAELVDGGSADKDENEVSTVVESEAVAEEDIESETAESEAVDAEKQAFNA